MPHLELSDLEPDEYVLAVALWCEAGLIRPWNDPDADLRRAMNGPASTVLGGRERGQLRATAMVGHDGHRGWIYYLAVEPDARRQGYGAQMVRACEAWLVEREIPKLNVMVRGGEDTLIGGFYAAVGYAPDDVVVLARRLLD